MTTVRHFGTHDLDATLAQMREGLQVIDRKWRYLYLNAAAAVHGRRPREELIGRTMMECYPGIDATEMFGVLEKCMSQRAPASLENKFTYPDGSVRVFELRIQPVEAGIAVLSIDVTDARRLESQLRQAQKMEAVGRLAAGVAHDFNNVLSVVLMYTDMILSDQAPAEPTREYLREIEAASNRAAAMTRQLLTFSRQQVAEATVLDLNATLVGLDRMLGRLLGADVTLTTIPARALGRVFADAGQIEQVVVNLVVNARDAMPRGGKLTIETSNVTLDDDYAREHFGVAPGEYVMVAVSDTGTGMDADTQTRIFEPFFTTKEPGKGTGLGLATVFGIVQRFGGHVWVYSEVGEGTTFKVYLPRTDAPVEARLVTSTAPASAEGGTETILLVENDDLVRAVAREVLRRSGYDVLDGRNGGEALLICERHAGEIHLLLTDVVLPLLSGRDLAERVVSLRPGMRVLFMSGYSDQAIVHHGTIDSGAPFLQKPLMAQSLLRKVREVLTSKGQ